MLIKKWCMARGIETKKSQWAKNKIYMYWICDMSAEKRIWQLSMKYIWMNSCSLHQHQYNDSQDSSVTIVTRLMPGTLGWILTEAKDFSLIQNVWTGSGAHPYSFAVGSVGSFPGGKVAGAGDVLLLTQYAFMACKGTLRLLYHQYTSN